MITAERTATNATSFGAWYRATLRPLLVKNAPGVIELYEHGHTKDGPCLALPMFVLGVAGVGKSTLLNSLISDWMPLIPQGGVGSFTSAAVRVVFASEPYLAIRRRPATDISELVRTLSSSAPSTRSVQEARLLVQGNQFADGAPPYLAKALYAALNGQVVDGTQSLDRARLTVLADVLRQDEQGWTVIDAGTRLPQLRQALADYAAGFLSPLVSDVEVGWDVPFLASGVQLVDLPGLGVAQDLHQQRAKEMLARAHACIVVVDRSGITEVCATALRPLLSRLLESTDASWGRLLVAATQLDQIARDQRANERRELRRSWQAHFDELGATAQQLIQGQFAQQLAGHGLNGERLRKDRAAIASSLQIVHVAPVEHRRFWRQDPEEPAAITSPEGAGIIQLRQLIRDTGSAWVEYLIQKLCAAMERDRRLQLLLGPAVREMASHLTKGTFTSW